MRQMMMALALAAVSTVAAAADLNFDTLEVGDLAPAVRGSEWVGAGSRAPELKNKVVLLDFWYSSCPTCIHKFSEVDQIADLQGVKVQVCCRCDCRNCRQGEGHHHLPHQSTSKGRYGTMK